MEKVILKSVSHEVSFNPKDTELFESFVYEPNELPDKKLGSLYILGQVDKKPGEEVAYILNLISSLMKREYYSDPNLEGKESFEKGLKKLNEVLKDFFRDKEIDLNLGILAINGDRMLISKLGKFKILLLRDKEFIDIFNNVGLFSKDKVQEQEFSNVVSGKLTKADSIFAYYPNKQVINREKKIKDILKGANHASDFIKGIEGLQAKTEFSCRGILLGINEIKESASSIPRPIISSSGVSKRSGVQNMLKGLPNIKKDEMKEAEGEEVKVNTASNKEEVSDAKIDPSELSLAKRENGIDRLFKQTKKIRSMKPKHRFIATTLAITLVMGGYLGYRRFNATSSGFRAARDIAETALQESGKMVSSNNLRGARASLSDALASLQEYSDNKKAQDLISQVESELDDLNKNSSKEPVLFSDLETEGISATHVISTDHGLYLFNEPDGKFTSLNSALEEEIVYIFLPPNQIHFADEEQKYDKTLKDEGIQAGAFYVDNFYFADATSIYKYTDVAKVSTKKSEWLDEPLGEDIISISVDGNLYALTSDGKAIEYFTGERQKEFDLQIDIDSNASIATHSDLDKLYVFNPKSKQIVVFNKDNGNLIETIDISKAGDPNSMAITNVGEIYVVSSDNKLWEVK